MKIFLIVFILFGLVGNAFPQEKQKIPTDFFIGRWVGMIERDLVYWSDGVGLSGIRTIHEETKVKEIIQVDFTIYHPLEKAEKMYNIKMDINKFPAENLLIEGQATQEIEEVYKHMNQEYCEECRGSAGKIKRLPRVTMPVTGDVYLEKGELRQLRFRCENVPKDYRRDFSLIKNDDEDQRISKKLEIDYIGKKITYNFRFYDKDDPDQDNRVKAELYKIEFLKKSFPKDIKPNEPIKTDKRTRIEITLPNVGKVNVAENTQAVFKSENLLEIAKGKIHSLIKKLKPKTKFDINTPTSVAGIRGTEYHIEVADDGTTTLIVLDGEVEISDLDKKKTVIVKKNQKSIVKTGELPSGPVDISPEQILEWWK